MKGYMLLDDGTILDGKAFGAVQTTCARAYFYTEMAGCEYLLRDPANAGKAMIMTYPLPGLRPAKDLPFKDNPKPAALIVKDYSELGAGGAGGSLGDYLIANGIFGLAYVDTRFLAKKIRSKGSFKCMLSADEKALCPDTLKNTALHRDYVSLASVENHIIYKQGTKKTAAILDLGTKNLLLADLEAHDINIHIFPYNASPDEIMAVEPDIVFVTNGGGEPYDYTFIAENIRALAARTNVFTIGLGSLLAATCHTTLIKLNNGHRGSNYPIMHAQTGKINILPKNIGYGVQLPADNDFQVLYESANRDAAIEGFSVGNLSAVLFSPEGSEWFKNLLGGMFNA